MATAQRHGVYPCSFVHSGGTLDFDQMESFSIEPQNQMSDVVVGGSVDRAAMISVATAAPRATLATRDLATLFATVSVTAGLNVISTGATFRAQQRSSNSTFSTGAVHETWSSTVGFLRPTAITATQEDQDGAICQLEYTALWDGSTLPFVANTNVDFDLLTDPAFSNRYFLGPFYLNAVKVEGVTSASFDPGINYVAKAYNGDAFPKLGAIVSRRPSLTVEVEDIESINGLGLFGNAATNAVQYFQHAADNGTRVAAATTTHAKITLAAGDITAQSITISGPEEDGSGTIVVMGEGTAAIATNSAIP